MAAAARTVASRFSIIVPAGKASPQPPVGSALGQRGLKLMDFCKAFNDQTAIFKEGTPIQSGDRVLTTTTFDWFIRAPRTSSKAFGVEEATTGRAATRRPRVGAEVRDRLAQDQGL